MATFAHKVLTDDLQWKGFDYATMEADLNEFGSQGWETVRTIIPSRRTIEIGIIVKRARG